MALSKTQNPGNLYIFLMIKSFLIWTFALSVCLLVVGFPVIALMVTVGALVAIALQAVLPVSAVLLVAGSLLGANLLAVMVGAAILTLKGIYPNQVSWLSWFHGKANPLHTSTYAACPLTCDLEF